MIFDLYYIEKSTAAHYLMFYFTHFYLDVILKAAYVAPKYLHTFFFFFNLIINTFTTEV